MPCVFTYAGGHSAAMQSAAHEYGKRVGLAFQLMDDVLDFEGSEASLGKPALNDLKEGLATAPVLLAAEQHHVLLVSCTCKIVWSSSYPTCFDFPIEYSNKSRHERYTCAPGQIEVYKLSLPVGR